MSDAARRLVREPGADDPRQYAERVHRLAWWYIGLFVLSLVGIGLLIWRAQLFVTLAQRSNVETLTLAFLLVFFAYLTVLSVRGALGALRLAGLSIGRDWLEQQRRKAEALGTSRSAPHVVDLNVLLEVEDRPGQPVQLVVADRAGAMGRVTIDGARMRYQCERGDGSNDVLAFIESQVTRMLRERGDDFSVDIVVWKNIDDEAAERYHGMVEFARNLERQLDKGDLWPKVRLSPQEVAELERRLSAICPALRDEGFLPQWDYAAEHKLPIIPEPLGLVTLSRSYDRVDPASSMGCAVLVVAVVVVILALFIFIPPWVPGL
ncbi:MAG TPA: hypothetical protein VGL99_05775 [Chloroflexota bacterium]